MDDFGVPPFMETPKFKLTVSYYLFFCQRSFSIPKTSICLLPQMAVQNFWCCDRKPLRRTSVSCCQGWKPIRATDAEEMFDEFRPCPTWRPPVQWWIKHDPSPEKKNSGLYYLAFDIFQDWTWAKVHHPRSKFLWKKETGAWLWDDVRFELTTKT